jgi:hypothetical protein
MAFDPNQLATEQSQRTAMDAAGAPTEFAGAPERLTQVAGGGPFKQLLEALGRSVIRDVPPAALPASPLTDPRFAPAPGAVAPAVPVQRIPTPQERRLLADNGQYSERAAKEALAPEVLSPEGVQRFQQRGLEAPAANAPLAAPPVEDVTQLGLNALDQQAADAAAGAEAIRSDAGKALNAEAQGFRAEAGVAPEAIADPALDALARRDLEIKSLKEGGDFNFDYLNTTDDVKAAITAVGETLSSEQAAITRGVISNRVTIEEAAKIAADETGLTRQLLKRRVGEGSLNAAEMLAARDLLVRSANKLSALAETVRSGQGSAVDRLAFRRQLAIHAGIQLQLKGAQTEAARALQSFRIPVKGELSAQRMSEEALRALTDSGSDTATDALARAILDTGRLPEGARIAALNKLTERGWFLKATDAVSEAYLAGLLSSPATQAKNIVGTSTFMAYQLPEEMIAGAWGAIIRKVKGKDAPYNLREDQVYIADAMYRAKGWIDSVGDAFRIASIAAKTEIPTDQMTKLDYHVGSIKWAGDNIFSRGINEFGKRARLPFRFLLAGDEFFKTISQRGELYVAAHRRYQAGLRAGETPQRALDEAGMVLLDPRSVTDEMVNKARYDTMTIDTGFLGKVAGQLQSIPVLGRIILPFSTAPTNDMLRTLERLPIPIGGKRLYQDLLGQNGPQAQQLALGRWSMGSMTFAYAAHLTAQGRLTGAMPDDAKERQALPPGWQPYSIVLRGSGFPKDADGEDMPLYDEYGRPNGPLTYVNYAGYGPVSAIVGLGASIPQKMAMSRDPQKSQSMAAAALGAVVNYYKELPMLQGIAQLMDFADTTSVEPIVRSPAVAATPIGLPNIFNSLQRAIQRAIDPIRITPRDDVEYYTMQDAEVGFASEDPLFSNPNGTISYRLVGSPKADAGQQMRETWTMMRAYQQQDSMFADERDLNAVMYDTLGNVMGAEDVSFSTRPGLALWNMTTGMVIKPGRELTAAESEMMRLAKDAGGWPITNPESIESIKLGAGAQSDLTRIAKNEVTLNLYGQGFADFRGALEQLIFTPQYMSPKTSDKEKQNLVRNLNSKFVDAGIETLLMLPEYANLAQAYQDVQSLKEQGLK